MDKKHAIPLCRIAQSLKYYFLSWDEFARVETFNVWDILIDEAFSGRIIHNEPSRLRQFSNFPLFLSPILAPCCDYYVNHV